MTRLATTIHDLLTTHRDDPRPYREVRAYIAAAESRSGLFFGVLHHPAAVSRPRAYLFSGHGVPEGVKSRFESCLGVQRIDEARMTLAYAYRDTPTKEEVLLGMRTFFLAFDADERVTIVY
jgi:hypothetical protein